MAKNTNQRLTEDVGFGQETLRIIRRLKEAAVENPGQTVPEFGLDGEEPTPPRNQSPCPRKKVAAPLRQRTAEIEII